MASKPKWTAVDYAKRVAIFFNFLLVICGLSMLIFGAWINATNSEFHIYTGDGGYISTSVLLIIGGLVIAVLGAIGCGASYRGSCRLILVYFGILSTLFLIEVIIGCVIYGQHDSMMLAAQNGLNLTITSQYGFNQPVTNSIDRLQQRRKCCGTKSWMDWRYSLWRKNESLHDRNFVPESCCITVSRSCVVTTSPSNIYYKGCGTALSEFVDENVYVIGGVCFALGFIQAIGIILTFYYYLKLREA
ncbi:Tetraspanin-11 [Trichoplax sp. H2]|uniref:Tetraspanin n=1 Tax=Trichoplax adhaerens TaxID=10228 RepID=B3S672_TRIAD|nr:hypothetical protein TRIADDRAFT_59701 [Trichoplax adhaerens]EDV21707.1 hypothetical protein TRIADDRAFT_59701 [Trichoplax adhaerens]RDD47418.1 Tetraspanin-11 [Trichoplax sp. H2]|eukprot:XP_002115855.1 hypothetical protein TRIADDRAFT_59701 [Trichoplax adhaerens]